MEVARCTWRLCSLCIALLTLTLLPWSVLQVSRVSLVTPVSRTKPKKCWQVSNMGRCRNTRGKITPGCLRQSGYREVSISRSQFCVHRLVTRAFLGPPPDEATWQVNHVDGNCSNNRLDNLEWVTCSQNIRHSLQNSQRIKPTRPVLVRPAGPRKWIWYASAKQAAQKLGQPASTFYGRCRRNAQADGFEYRFADIDWNTSEEVWQSVIDPRSGVKANGTMVSSRGRLRSKSMRVWIGSRRSDGYMRTEIKMRSCCQTEYVHRLVAFAFLGPPPTPEHTHVNHKDMNKSNNAASNLEYATPSENMRHRYANRKYCNPSCKAVLSRVYGSHGDWRHHPSVTSAAEMLGVHVGCISGCAKGNQRQTSGYEFRFAADEAIFETLPGEEWRDVDLEFHLEDRRSRPKKKKDGTIWNRHCFRSATFGVDAMLQGRQSQDNLNIIV